MDAALRRRRRQKRSQVVNAPQSMRADAVRVRGLSKAFGPILALDHVDLDVPAGRFTCLIGPSGCGKTTLLRLLAGLERPSAGSIEIDGRDVSHAPPAGRGVGMVFQSYALFPNMDVTANVAFGMKRGVSRAERGARAGALLETVGLRGLGDRRPHQLSGGQQQRVAIARALATEPRILLLDEPLAALDPLMREQVRAELKTLQRRLGVTTVMVTHDQAEAMAVADQVAVIRAGRIEQVGPAEVVYSQPASPFVAGFVGAANRIEAQVADARTIRLWGKVDSPADAAGWPNGERVWAIVRPEAIRLAGPEEPGLAGQVTNRLFAGAAFRLLFAPDAAPDAVMALDVPAGQPCPQVGAAVRLIIPPERLRLFRPDGATE
jgi:iron(III) transport system ATP-binding protein